MSNTTINMKSEYLTPEEQEFDNLLTDQLIEVIRNPSMRKDFILQTSNHEQYRFNKFDIPSELEHCALFRFNIYNDNYERALMWAEQTKDELIKHYMLSAYYRFSASGAPVTEENTQSLFLRSFEHGYQSYAGIPCNLFAEYAEYLMKSKNEVDLIELAFMIFAVGLHCMNPADPNVINTFNQQCTREEVELIQRMLQIIKEYAENSKEEEAKDIFMNFYHIESAYYYACTGRIQLAKKEIALLANEYVQELYDFNNLTEEEREQRHEDLRIAIIELILDVLEEETEHLHLMKKYATMAFRFEAPPKRPRPQKGSFDWLYNQGEKSYLAILNNKATDKDYANIRAVAEAYRTGNGVRQNLRLAECWDKMAKH